MSLALKILMSAFDFGVVKRLNCCVRDGVFRFFAMRRLLENAAATSARWFGWCASIVGLFAAAGANCPCCGRVTCPVGVSGWRGG